ncbi:unnamed protein product [Hymenolepis diminuta]|uniref:HABP4_PAI-RBP1 domain-containing protein n=1 Tax=Hymenolepis diminuta TaxID=6216 RepID=A0A0R3SMC6_HYMDI|nr:unnamed protein product [Hymenolepis diminuta]VUZ48924.1 unnamed protein product [Hymenolepis diminuta]
MSTKKASAISKADEENGEGEEKKSTGVESEEMRQVATEATRSAKAPWKDIESGKVGTTIEETKIELRNSGTHNGWAFVDPIEVGARLATVGDKVNGHPSKTKNTTDPCHEQDLGRLFAH